MLAGWALGRPALWLDEAASAVAVERSWPQLWQLWGGTDAPLVPYYVLLKALTGAAVMLAPGLSEHPEVLLRGPSALAAAGSVAILVSWLRAVWAQLPAVVAGGVLITFEGFSRYAQEARPYALILLLAVTATALWGKLVRTASVPSAVGYMACLATMTCLHVLSAMLVAAHLSAFGLLRTRTGSRDNDPLLTVLLLLAAVLAALLLSAPAALAAIWFGGGASHYPSLSVAAVLAMLARLFGGPGPFTVTVCLAVTGLSRWNHHRDADLTRIAACWVLVPWLIYLPAVLARPNLLIGRYLLFTLPGWAVLVVLGLLALGDAAFSGAHPVVLCAASGLLALFQAPVLAEVREPDGHGQDVRAMATLLRQPRYADLPVVTTTATDLLQLVAYSPQAADRLGVQAMGSTNIWPTRLGRAEAQQHLAGAPSVLLVIHSGSCRPTPSALHDFRPRWGATLGTLTVVMLSRTADPKPEDTPRMHVPARPNPMSCPPWTGLRERRSPGPSVSGVPGGSAGGE